MSVQEQNPGKSRLEQIQWAAAQLSVMRRSSTTQPVGLLLKAIVDEIHLEVYAENGGYDLAPSAWQAVMDTPVRWRAYEVAWAHCGPDLQQIGWARQERPS